MNDVGDGWHWHVTPGNMVISDKLCASILGCGIYAVL